eukprot:TRINITY_DN6059_c0_g1_i1.p1 TRINITY_DN6059_c0_g1~~TRINITY_DN6059_c0_g1_i1.p1  ORF type:complete len:358 (-),score=66.28 TRINITY_DN6059_c0_g1_i1:88-1161(-)
MLELVYEGLCDNVFLISGDGDFKSAVKAVLRQKKGVYVVGFNDGSMSADLQEQATEIIWLDAYWTNISSGPETTSPVLLPDDNEEVPAQLYKPPTQTSEPQKQAPSPLSGGKKQKKKAKARKNGPLLGEEPIQSPPTDPTTPLPQVISSSSSTAPPPAVLMPQAQVKPAASAPLFSPAFQSASSGQPQQTSTNSQTTTSSSSSLSSPQALLDSRVQSTTQLNQNHLSITPPAYTSFPTTTSGNTKPVSTSTVALPSAVATTFQPTWACKICTYDSNGEDHAHCEVCGSDRTATTFVPTSLTPVATTSVAPLNPPRYVEIPIEQKTNASSSEWDCELCTFKNQMSSTECEICGNPTKS